MAKGNSRKAVDYGEPGAGELIGDLTDRLYFPPRSPVLLKEGTNEPHEPTADTREIVAALASFGTGQEEIAKYVGISSKTLRKHYRDELDRSQLTANMMVGKSLYQQCMLGSVPALIFWAKTRMGWKEAKVIEHTGNSGAPTVNIILKGRDDHGEAQTARVALMQKPALPAPDSDDSHG